MAGYSKTPLLKKMGIKDYMRGILMHAPEEVRLLFKNAPLNFSNNLTSDFDYIHLFAKNEKELRLNFPTVKKHLRPDGILWISWPKSGKLGTDLNENKIREIGLIIGLVDIKVAAIDETWSGLKFVYRLKDR